MFLAYLWRGSADGSDSGPSTTSWSRVRLKYFSNYCMKFDANIHGTQRMNSTDAGDPEFSSRAMVPLIYLIYFSTSFICIMVHSST